MTHPYRGLPSWHFWSRAVAYPGLPDVDPVIDAPFRIDRTHRVATMGSCFAQHLSRFLVNSGLGYFVAEDGADLPVHERVRRGFGVFSARYGNVYTTRQAVQLFDRAFDRRPSHAGAWLRGDGRFVDPYRPQAEPDGFLDEAAVDGDRAAHLAAVRRVFTDCDVLVLTLGLTEGWVDTRTGDVYPVVPGSAGGSYDQERHLFVNFGVGDVVDDLLAFLDRVHEVNPAARVLLTVSPVPLIATFSDQHVLSATTYSKSVLRVAAAEAEAQRPFAHYFPSYEIITGPPAGNTYFRPDLRSVSDDGVAHVMRVFQRHYVDSVAPLRADGPARLLESEMARVGRVVCDEEVLDEGSSACS